VDRQSKLYALKVAGVAGTYYGAAKLGLDLAFSAKSVTAVWPPTGIALAALVLWGYRLWPGVALGALLANSWTGVPFYTVLGITVGNTLEALVGTYLLRRAGFRPSIDRVRDVVALAVLAGAVSTAVSATIGVTSLVIGDEIHSGAFGTTWRTWWLGDMGGDLLVAPALLIGVTHWPYNRAPGGRIEAAALALLTGGLTALVFTHEVGLTYLLFPPLIFAALRLWQPGAAGAALIMAAIAIPLTEHNRGPFAGNSPDERLLLAQTFVGVACLTGLVLAAVITERKRAEDTVEHIAETLQESLLPSRLPDIPGIEATVDFRPAGERHRVGGDFFDLFEADDGSWAVVVGDVCGKGARAAAVTGLARYTLRAAAIHESRPSSILKLLNDAILRQRSLEEFCTVAYARLELNGADSVRATVSSGGHPLPLLLRADGAVEPVGRFGTLLGVVEEPELTDYTADLASGDTLVLYTDGLTDAYAPQRVVTAEDLVSVLETCAGASAPEIAQGIRAAVLDGNRSEPRDDIALLVLRLPDRPRVQETEIVRRLARDPHAVSVAREAIGELEPVLGRALFGNVRLLVSELVTNSIRHAHIGSGDTIELRVAVFADRLRVEVSDGGAGFVRRVRAPERGSGSGWGLYLVDQLADRWGVSRDDATRVWFEIDRE
jgi:serine phosphatase RsbU (regulator of sigma subunit)/integral membrane sensor domain MASE1/anti-sigma regulatory factor (Ser/Thr protein kinase)